MIRDQVMRIRSISPVVIAMCVAGCAVALPEPSAPNGKTSEGTSAHVADVGGESLAVIPVTVLTAQDKYIRHRLGAQKRCSQMDNGLQAFALQLKTGAQTRTLWGSVTTAFLGAGGAIATAISSSTQTVNGSNINGQNLTTVLGAVTAGVTAVGTALTLAVIGPAPADTLAAINDADKKVVSEWAKFDTACPIAPPSGTTWNDANYTTCSASADGAAVNCTADFTSVRLRAPDYVPPSDGPSAPPAAAPPHSGRSGD